MTHHLAITDRGAVPGTLATAAIQACIDELAARGGGTVLVPPGTWIAGTIELRSGITLQLHPAAVLQASTDLAHYRDCSPTHGTDGNKDRQPFHLLVADGCERVAITGGGAIDGQGGPAWWDEPLPGQRWWREKRQRVSPLLEIRASRHVTISDVTIRRSPGWTVHLFCCDEVRLRGVTVENDVYGPNTDGFDINGCRDVFVSDCKLTCGDDGIIIKATRDARSCERIVITNCVVRSNCIAYGIGCECSSDVRQVAISNCVAHATMRMFAIGMWEGGTAEDITVTNLVGDTVCALGMERPIHLDLKQHAQSTPISRDPAVIGRVRNVTISNVVARTRGRILMTAQDGACLENIVLRDVRLIYPEVEDHAARIAAGFTSSQLSNHSPAARVAPAAVVADNCRGLRLHHVEAHWPDPNPVPMHGLWLRNVGGGRIDCPDLRGSGRADTVTAPA